ncbi:hypothetical protein [Desulfobacula toluolica]|uniref:Uncharacterized protein n=1 Tax=Desulfobacula toluolica (strain DSM 7467 / Tol2) TaxID=651182 RepID=K0NNH1_DESTT|nr:hypothetical protein [Desulfobacula toluolica]CCK82205.1 uncharacterized protein TOL2_C40500 [Desulfobacula toluolica Tol2]
MNFDNPEARAYLFELYTVTQGDPKAQVSMYDVGATLGLEKTDAGAMAEDLFIRGFAELKTLSGGIGITVQGLEELDVQPDPVICNDDSLVLGKSTVLENKGQKAVEKILQDIKASLVQTSPPYEKLEEIVMDIKTIEIQMLSPRPKTAVIREVLRSLHQSISASGTEDLAVKLMAITDSGV